MKVEIYQIYTIYNIDTGDGDVLPCHSWRRGWRTLPLKDLGAVGPRRAIDQSYRHRLTPENIWLLYIYFPVTPTFIDFDFVFLGTNDIEIAWYFSISIENLNRTQQLNHHLHEVQQFAWILMDFLISVFHVTFIFIILISAIRNTVICIVAFFLCVACFELQCFSPNGFGLGHSC